jgi:hypothetical protein
MDRDPDYFEHIKLDYEDSSTRSAFDMAKNIAALTGTRDWVPQVERAVLRTHLRDIGERNTTIARIGPVYMALELEAVDRSLNCGPGDVPIKIRGHFLPKNRDAAEVAYNAQRDSWFAAYGDPALCGDAAIGERALHRVYMRLFDPFARSALSCERPADRLAGEWVAMVHGYAQLVVDGLDEGTAVAHMKRLVLRRRIKECDAA